MVKYIIYGAGKLGREAVSFIGKDRIIAFFDKYTDAKSVDGIPVYRPNFTNENYHDLLQEGQIVICIGDQREVIEVAKDIDKWGVTGFYSKK